MTASFIGAAIKPASANFSVVAGSYPTGATDPGSDAAPSAELEYVSDRDGGFKQPLEIRKLLTRWAFEYFDHTASKAVWFLSGNCQKQGKTGLQQAIWDHSGFDRAVFSANRPANENTLYV